MSRRSEKKVVNTEMTGNDSETVRPVGGCTAGSRALLNERQQSSKWFKWLVLGTKCSCWVQLDALSRTLVEEHSEADSLPTLALAEKTTNDIAKVRQYSRLLEAPLCSIASLGTGRIFQRQQRKLSTQDRPNPGQHCQLGERDGEKCGRPWRANCGSFLANGAMLTATLAQHLMSDPSQRLTSWARLYFFFNLSE